MRARLAGPALALALASSAAPAPAHDLAQPTRAWWAGATFAAPSVGLPLQGAASTSTTPAATPRADCGPGSRPEGDLQGRVPADATSGFTCNVERVGRAGVAGGYKVLRFVDRAGRECAYYDTTLLFPLNALTLSATPSIGVAVLDMSDPSRPVQTDLLTTAAMLSPHESLELNQRRGLLAAVMGTPVAAPGVVDLYDLNEDCRHPRLRSSLPVGLIGHESGFALDGRTFYATSIGTGQITAIDVSDPALPVPLWVGRYKSHGLMLSDDGDRAYVAAREGLLVLDVSEVQARRPNPQVREVSRLTWPTRTIPQVAIPITVAGRPYVVEVDEFSHDAGDDPDAPTTRAARNGDRVGAARIIDISDERAPVVVSDLRLAVHQPEHRAEIAGDPGAQNRLAGYAAHYCDVPRRVDPAIVACSFIGSGLRVFDIRDPRHPREVAYHVAPPAPGPTRGDPVNWAMSRPAFVPERREVWYSDGASGFYALRVAAAAWPVTSATATRRTGCGSAARRARSPVRRRSGSAPTPGPSRPARRCR